MPRHLFARAQQSPGLAGRLIASDLRTGGRPYPPLLYRGPHLLRAAASMSGRATPHEALAVVVSHLGRLSDTGDLAVQSANKMQRSIAMYVDYVCEAFDVESFASIEPAHVAAWVAAPVIGPDGDLQSPSLATQHHRRAAVRLAHQIARRFEIADTAPALDLALPPRIGTSRRPCDDDEIMLGREYCDSFGRRTRHPAVWALLEASATTGEAPRVQVRDVDLEEGTVDLPGAPGVEARTARLTDWGRRALSVQIGTRTDGPLIFSGSSGPSGQASVSAAALEVLQRAGIHQKKVVVPMSVRGWSGARVFLETGRIDDAAKVLGLRSLDTAAVTVGWDWQGDR